jgi:hypothetical protein
VLVAVAFRKEFDVGQYQWTSPISLRRFHRLLLFGLCGEVYAAIPPS